MAILVYIDGTAGEIKKSSREAISYGFAAGQLCGDKEIIAVAPGTYDSASLKKLGQHGAARVLHLSDEYLNENQGSAHAQALASVVASTGANLIIFPKSSFCDVIAGRLAASIGAAIVSGVVALPDFSNGFMVKKSIFTGKSFATVEVTGDKKVLLVRKNTCAIKDDGADASVEQVATPAGISFNEKITGQHKADGDILLEEADIVVSGGRGLKGPEHWGIIEDLAKALGAATGCSKPVSDMGWRPHHEHVGQTGVKVSPNLYIAVGISGAIQHLAGVNSSKVLVAINKDPEAPFFKAADYGIVGDAFEILPKLTKKISS